MYKHVNYLYMFCLAHAWFIHYYVPSFRISNILLKQSLLIVYNLYASEQCVLKPIIEF